MYPGVSNLGKSGRIWLKFGVWLDINLLSVSHKRGMRILTGDLAQMHVRTPFRIPGTAERISLKFGVWLKIHKLCVLHKPTIGYICTYALLFHISRMARRIALNFDKQVEGAQ